MKTIGELYGYKGELPEVEHFTREDRANGFRWLYRCDAPNAKGETLAVEVMYCDDPGGKDSLPKLWHRNGSCDYIPEWWALTTCVEDSDGRARRAYCPQVTEDHRHIDFNWHLPATPENLVRLLNETYRRFTEAR